MPVVTWQDTAGGCLQLGFPRSGSSVNLLHPTQRSPGCLLPRCLFEWLPWTVLGSALAPLCPIPSSASSFQVEGVWFLERYPDSSLGVFRVILNDSWGRGAGLPTFHQILGEKPRGGPWTPGSEQIVGLCYFHCCSCWLQGYSRAGPRHQDVTLGDDRLSTPS